MTDREPGNKRKPIIIDLDENPGLAKFLERLKKGTKNPKGQEIEPFSRTNAVGGEQKNPRHALRRGLQPQE